MRAADVPGVAARSASAKKAAVMRKRRKAG